MKNPINQKDLRRFLYQVGFPRAIVWSEEKLRMMAVELVYNIAPEEVPGEYQDLYSDLKSYAKTGAYIEWAPPQRKRD